MQVIRKYRLHDINIPEVVQLPEDARIIGWDLIGNDFYLWALGDTGNYPEERAFMLAMENFRIPHKVVATYGTRDSGDRLYLHLLEVMHYANDTPAKSTNPIDTGEPNTELSENEQ